MKKHFFTLLELIVVITVMAAAAGLGIAQFRGQSPARRLDDAALQWQEFCARVRFQALESGEKRQVVFNPEQKLFSMKVPAENPETPETETENEEEQRPAVRIEWRLPDDFELAKDFPPQDEEPDEDGTYLMFTFYSDGGAAGQRRLELRLGELVRIFEISTLTGRLIEIPEEKK